MSVSVDIIKKILLEIGKPYNYQMIITGSCADMFNIGYDNIDDIDIIIDETIFNTNKDSMLNYEHIISLKSKIDGHILDRYEYKYIDEKNSILKIRIDFLVKNKDIIEKETYITKEYNISYIIISPQKRYNQLLNHNYRKSASNYEEKIKKVKNRIMLYENFLGIKNPKPD